MTSASAQVVDPVAGGDPYDTQEYGAFVESMAKNCQCLPPWPCPCDGVLAGGLCDGLDHQPDFTLDDLDWSEEYE